MKRTYFVFAIFLTFGLFLGCNHAVSDPKIEIVYDSTPTQFEGSWKHPNPDAKNATFTFSGNRFVYTRDNGIRKTGFIQYSSTELKLVVDGTVVRTYSYTIQTDILNLKSKSGNGNLYFYGPYKKQP